MLTRLQVRNFKRFDSIDVELGNPVVFVGPNNSGKTTALQALALWDLGLRSWFENRGEDEAATRRYGVGINRRDFLAAAIPEANLLWRDLHVRKGTTNIRIDISVTGVTQGKEWVCGLEFDYANSESFYCRPLRRNEGKDSERLPVPVEAKGTRVSFLPPMSGLADREFVKQAGEVGFLIGQGRTAEVLRNLCNQAYGLGQRHEAWTRIRDQMEKLFGIKLNPPELRERNAELVMSYREQSGVNLDLSSAGRGVQQTLLLLAYLSTNPGAVLLLDEPDAHLEILRQRQIYDVLSATARDGGGQIIIASHSEVILNEAADRDVVVAFVGSPHRIDDRGSQVLKSLKEIGFDHYYQAEQRGWVLYLEGSTDLAILQSFARSLDHPATEVLEQPFVRYVGNDLSAARSHFHGLREAKTDLVGFTLCDRIDRPLQPSAQLTEFMWPRREIENYVCQPETLRAYSAVLAESQMQGRLFDEMFITAMQEAIDLLVPPIALRDRSDQWWLNVKASDDFLDRLFERFFTGLKLPNLMRKSDYHQLARFVALPDIAPEVGSVLDSILAVSRAANPRV